MSILLALALMGQVRSTTATAAVGARIVSRQSIERAGGSVQSSGESAPGGLLWTGREPAGEQIVVAWVPGHGQTLLNLGPGGPDLIKGTGFRVIFSPRWKAQDEWLVRELEVEGRRLQLRQADGTPLPR